MRILIADQDLQAAQTLDQLLRGVQYETLCLSDGDAALREALRRSFALIITETVLPNHDGFAITRELRRLHVQTPILFLTDENTVASKVQGLDAGADDYLTKPYDPDELLARVRALIRRSTPAAPTELQFGDLIFRPGTVSLHCGSNQVRLNYKESELMKLFMAFPQQIASKEELIHKVWGYASGTSDNNVEAYISFLRKKLATLESRVSIIAIKKQGYKLEYTP